MSVETQKFGPWVRDQRKHTTISASKMARELDMAWSHYAALEKGDSGPPRDYARLRKIAELLGLDVAEVYEIAGALPNDWLELAERRLRKQPSDNTDTGA